MKVLLTITAAIEIAAGVGALLVPSFAVEILLGTPLEAPAALIVARVAGAALLTIGLVCLAARSEPQGRVARGTAAAMIFYNAAVAGLLLYANFGAGLSGIGLWPAAILHVAMAGWCVAGAAWTSRQRIPS